MESRYISYNCVITYLGNLAEDELIISINSLRSELPAFITFVDYNIMKGEFLNDQFLNINIVFHITPGIFSDDKSRVDYIMKLRNKWTNKLNDTFKEMKLIYSIEIS